MKEEYIFFTKEEYEKLVKACIRATDAMTRIGICFNEATRAMIDLSAAMQAAREKTDEIQVEE